MHNTMYLVHRAIRWGSSFPTVFVDGDVVVWFALPAP